jgi:hemerythrin
VDAQVEVLRMYLEKKPREDLLRALDRLIERSRLTFSEEEALMQGYAPNPDPRHADLHHEVLAQMVLLREYAMDFDRTRVLAQLIVVDRKLTSHLLEGIEELEFPA